MRARDWEVGGATVSNGYDTGLLGLQFQLEGKLVRFAVAVQIIGLRRQFDGICRRVLAGRFPVAGSDTGGRGIANGSRSVDFGGTAKHVFPATFAWWCRHRDPPPPPRCAGSVH